MKFKINVGEFVKVLESSHEVATRNPVKEFPYAEKITLESKKDEIVIYAFGGVISSISHISNALHKGVNYKCLEEGIVTVNSKSFSSYLDTFPPEEDIEILIDKKNFLKMVLISNTKESCGTPIYEDHVEPFNIANKFSQELSIDREIFLSGFNKVLFGATDIEKYYYYHCIAIEANKKHVMFSSGTGARFVMDIFEGNKITSDISEDVDIKIPSKYAPTIKKIIESSKNKVEEKESDNVSDRINIKYSKGDEALGVPEQIVFDMGSISLYIKDIAKFENYPKLSSVFNHKYNNKIICDLKDWQYPIKRIMATFYDHDEEIHNTEVKLEDENMVWETDTKIKATGNIPIDAKLSKSEKEKSDVWFRANSIWLSDMATCSSRSGKIEILFDSQEYLNQDNLSQENIRKFRRKPILVKYMEDKDAIKSSKDIVEKFYLFFVIAS